MATATVEHMPIQYADASGYVTADAEDATTATVFTPDSEVILHMVKTVRGVWAPDTSDHWQLTTRETRKRWPSAELLLADMAAARRLQLTEHDA